MVFFEVGMIIAASLKGHDLGTILKQNLHITLQESAENEEYRKSWDHLQTKVRFTTNLLISISIYLIQLLIRKGLKIDISVRLYANN